MYLHSHDNANYERQQRNIIQRQSDEDRSKSAHIVHLSDELIILKEQYKRLNDKYSVIVAQKKHSDHSEMADQKKPPPPQQLGPATMSSSMRNSLPSSQGDMQQKLIQRGKTISMLQENNRGLKFLNSQMMYRMDPQRKLVGTPTKTAWDPLAANSAPDRGLWLRQWDTSVGAAVSASAPLKQPSSAPLKQPSSTPLKQPSSFPNNGARAGDHLAIVESAELKVLKTNLKARETSLQEGVKENAELKSELRRSKVTINNMFEILEQHKGKLRRVGKIVDELVEKGYSLPTDLLTTLHVLTTILPDGFTATTNFESPEPRPGPMMESCTPNINPGSQAVSMSGLEGGDSVALYGLHHPRRVTLGATGAIPTQPMGPMCLSPDPRLRARAVTGTSEMEQVVASTRPPPRMPSSRQVSGKRKLSETGPLSPASAGPVRPTIAIGTTVDKRRKSGVLTPPPQDEIDSGSTVHASGKKDEDVEEGELDDSLGSLFEERSNVTAAFARNNGAEVDQVSKASTHKEMSKEKENELNIPQMSAGGSNSGLTAMEGGIPTNVQRSLCMPLMPSNKMGGPSRYGRYSGHSSKARSVSAPTNAPGSDVSNGTGIGAVSGAGSGQGSGQDSGTQAPLIEQFKDLDSMIAGEMQKLSSDPGFSSDVFENLER